MSTFGYNNMEIKEGFLRKFLLSSYSMITSTYTDIILIQNLISMRFKSITQINWEILFIKAYIISTEHKVLILENENYV